MAMISLDADVIESWSADHGLSDSSDGELVRSTVVQRLVEDGVRRLNEGLNRWETIKRWAILDRDLTIEAGELTPSLKVKRALVAERYREIIESLYE